MTRFVSANSIGTFLVLSTAITEVEVLYLSFNNV